MPDTIIPESNQPGITVTKAHGFVVVSWWQAKSSDGRRGTFDYELHDTLNDALNAYREYQDGEYHRAAEMGIFTVDAIGLPVLRLAPETLMKLMAEVRAA